MRKKVLMLHNFKEYLKVTGQEDPLNDISLEGASFDDKLTIIKAFLEDRKAFLTIKDVIDFANDKLHLHFIDQKESRETTISRIISRIRTRPELKDLLKSAVISIRNEKAHGATKSKSKKEVISAETFIKWADIIKNI
jgi:hypothetical protein